MDRLNTPEKVNMLSIIEIKIVTTVYFIKCHMVLYSLPGGPKSKLFIIIEEHCCLLSTNFHNFWHICTIGNLQLVDWIYR